MMKKFSLEKGKTHYTSNAGLLELREGICNYLSKNGVTLKEGNKYANGKVTYSRSVVSGNADGMLATISVEVEGETEAEKIANFKNFINETGIKFVRDNDSVIKSIETAFKDGKVASNSISWNDININNISVYADAKRVDISFCNLKNNDDQENTNDSYTEHTSRLIIRDDGIGMNLEDIENKWLNIAYSEKKNNSRQHNRMMAGAKGVGRFSCDRLGHYLNLYTNIFFCHSSFDKHFTPKVVKSFY